MGQHKYQIYQVKNVKNNKIYIGKTRRSAYTRLAEHASGHCPELRDDIAKYGIENFHISILRECIGKEDAKIMERFHISNASRKGNDMYNIYCTEKVSHRAKKATHLNTEKVAVQSRKLFGLDLKKLKKKHATELSKSDFDSIVSKLKHTEDKYIAVELDKYDVIIVKRAN